MSFTDASPAGCATEHARQLVALAAAQGVRLRVLGGVAIALRASPQTPSALLRASNDLDLAAEEGAGRRAGAVLLSAGLLARSERFNTLHSHRRLVFVGNDEAPSLKIDVFVGDLEMCHSVPLRRRLEQDPLTLAPTDLLLSKGQIVRLTAKDRLDLYCLLWNHEITDDRRADSSLIAPERGDDGTDRAARLGADPLSAERASAAAIDAGYIADLCARDWGWWRTLSANLATCLRTLPATSLPDADRARIGERLAALEHALAVAPKSLRWRARSRIGDRLRWFEEPEELEGPTPSGSISEDPVPPVGSS